MFFKFLQKFFEPVSQHVIQNAASYAKGAALVVFTASVTIAASNSAHKKLETKHRKEDAERYKAEFDRKLKDLEKKYKDNEDVLKQKIRMLCDEFGIDPVV